MKRYFGLDLGSKTVGIAFSESGIIANNLTTIRFKENDYEDALNQLLVLMAEYQITDCIIGYPKHMNNDIGIRAKISEDFREKLLLKANINAILWDERMSTKAVSLITRDALSKKNKKAKKDELSAVIILQNYLDYKEKK